MKTGILFIVCLLGLSSPAVQKPNVMIFLVDDLGVMDSSLPFLTDGEGNAKKYPLNEYYRTPNMERLGARGIRFETFYANSVCSPSRVSLMTGQSSARHRTTQWINPEGRNPGPEGWNWNGLDSGSVTLPRLLQAQGYRTIHVGKAHFGSSESDGADPLCVGFDENVAGAAIGRPASYYGEKDYGAGDLRQPPHLEAYHGTDTFLTEALTREAIRKLDKAVEQEKPFFLHMSHYAVHSPFDPDPRFVDHYDPTAVGGDHMPAFASLVEGMDKSLGDLLDHLEKLGVADNTLVFFLGDNGTDAPVFGGAREKRLGHFSAAPLRGKKATCYEGGIRIPFIAAWAKPDADNPWQERFPVAQGAITTQAFASIEDLMPSILALVGAEVPESHVMDGFNILPALAEADTPTGRDQFLMHFPHRHRSINFTSYRKGRWKIIRHYDSGRDELYDLDTDPFEQNDLAESHSERLASLQKAMQEQLDAADAQYWSGNKTKE